MCTCTMLQRNSSLYLRFLPFYLFILTACYGQFYGSIIPLYAYPTLRPNCPWRELIEVHKTHHANIWVVVNVDNGPGKTFDKNYFWATSALQSAGIKTLGNVPTNYARRQAFDISADISNWRHWYNLTGIFFDEMAYEESKDKVKYYQEVAQIANTNGFRFTVGNAGILTSPKYFAAVNNIVVYESDAGVPSRELICYQETMGKGLQSVTILAYNISKLNCTSISDIKHCAGYIYATSSNGNQPWDTLPYYLADLFKMLGT